MSKAPDLEELLSNLDKESSGSSGKVKDPQAEHFLLALDQIHVDPAQPRKKITNIPDLVAQIKEAGGLLQPISVREDPDPAVGGYIIIYGERRYRAALEMGWTHIPATIRTQVKTGSIHTRQLFENIGRQDMDVVDEAHAVKKFIRDNKIATYAEAAKRLGKSVLWVSQRMDLTELSQEDQAAVSRGDMTLGIASAKAKATAGRLREGSVAHQTAVDHGFDVRTKRNDHRPVQTSKGLSGRDSTPSWVNSDNDPNSVITDPQAKPRYKSLNAHFSDDHPLAGRARSRCKAGTTTNASMHSMKIGGVACGACWEYAIRIDAVTHPENQDD